MNEGTPQGSMHQQLLHLAELLATPIDFDRLIADGVLRRRGSWYEVLDLARLPEHARLKIKDVKAGDLVKFRKPGKKARKLFR